MFLQLICVIALTLAVKAAVLVQPAAPVVAARISEATYDVNPQYSFGYDVQDTLTGDSKAQVESRNGDVVRGQYSLTEPDGSRRIVDYTADPVNGFNAVVRKAPAAIAAPVISANLISSAPVAEPVVARAIAAPLILG